MFNCVLIMMLLFSEFHRVLLLYMNLPTALLKVAVIIVVVHTVGRMKTLSLDHK